MGQDGRSVKGKRADQRKSDTATFYDAVAPGFEADYYGLAGDPSIRYDVASFEETLERAIRGRRYQRALELGCGSGHWLRWLEARGIPSVGVDISFEMCRTVATLDGNALQGEIATLPIETSSCDLIISPYCALDHCEAYVQAFEELNRVATPDAVAVLMLDNAERLISRYWRVDIEGVRSLESDPRRDGKWAHQVGGRSVVVFTKMFTVEEVRSLLKDWRVDITGLGLLSPLVPHWLRRSRPHLVSEVLRRISSIERYLCRRFPGHSALLVVTAKRGPSGPAETADVPK